MSPVLSGPVRTSGLPASRLVALAVLLSLAPATSPTLGRGCPQFARVPGYGACSNIGGRSCSFCIYRCNDDTVVRWNVCGP